MNNTSTVFFTFGLANDIFLHKHVICQYSGLSEIYFPHHASATSRSGQVNVLYIVFSSFDIFQSINICATSTQHHFDFDCYMIDWIPKTVWEPIMTHIFWFMLQICYITFIGRHMRVIKCISKRHKLLAPHKLPLYSCPRKTGIK